MSALLGALKAQCELGIAAIGGKDSMSGTFENIDVPPTLVSFAIAAHDAKKLITPEFKSAGDKVYLIAPEYTKDNLPDYESLRGVFDKVHGIAASGKAKAIYTVDLGGVAEGVVKMSMGNRIGFKGDIDDSTLFGLKYGAFIIEADGELGSAPVRLGEHARAGVPDYSSRGQARKGREIQLCKALGARSGGQGRKAPRSHSGIPRHELRVRHDAPL